jgi:NADH-quinone oxidoreductase subunit N
MWGGMIRVDTAGFVFRLIFLTGAALTALFAARIKEIGSHAVFFALLVISTIGMSLMASAADLVMLYLAIEMTSLPMYILAGFAVKENSSVESGLKYLLYGAMASAVMLYGLSLLYGFTGTTQLYEIVTVLQSGAVSLSLQLVILFLVMAGFGFKVSAVPFHFWAPDVYHGSPTPVSGYLSTASKAAGFIVLMRFLFSAFSYQQDSWGLLIAILATVSMFTGNLLALVQKNLKRLFAYSSIAHAGYILIGVAAGNALGIKASMYYLIAYLFTNLAAFGVITIVERQKGSSEIETFRGLSKSSPGLAYILLASLLSLGGIPPFGGFISKVLVFASAAEANLIWLLLVGVLNSIIALYYYLQVMRIIFEDTQEVMQIPVSKTWKFALGVCVIGIIILGVIYTPWLNLVTTASTNLMLLH